MLAHELSHIGRDVAIMTVSSFFAMVAALLMRVGLFGGMFGGGRDRGGGTPVWLIMFLVAMLTYVLSYVLILMISRYREYAADRGAAIITGAPENLMSALQRIAGQIQQIPQKDLREVQGLNAFFIVPTSHRVLVRRALHDAPAARAARPARRDLAGHGPSRRPLGHEAPAARPRLRAHDPHGDRADPDLRVVPPRTPDPRRARDRHAGGSRLGRVSRRCAVRGRGPVLLWRHIHRSESVALQGRARQGA